MKAKQDNLKEAISLLKKKQSVELRLLKNQIDKVHESIKPVNLIKNAFHQVASAPDIKNNILGNIIGLASGYVSKRIFIGGSHNPITHIVGKLLQIGITNVTSKNADTIKSIGEKVAQFVFKKSEKDKLKNSIADN
jgi:hypothetical protein